MTVDYKCRSCGLGAMKNDVPVWVVIGKLWRHEMELKGRGRWTLPGWGLFQE